MRPAEMKDPMIQIEAENFIQHSITGTNVFRSLQSLWHHWVKSHGYSPETARAVKERIVKIGIKLPVEEKAPEQPL